MSSVMRILDSALAEWSIGILPCATNLPTSDATEQGLE
jgi:hypothetical protein